MSKKENKKIQDHILKMNNQQFELGHDPIAAELDEDNAYQKDGLAEAREQIKSFEEDILFWNKEIVKIEKRLAKLEAMRAKHEGKTPKARK